MSVRAPTDRVEWSASDGALERRIESRLAEWDRNGFARRMWAKDPTLWADPPVPEIADRLGWLDLPASMTSRLPEFTGFARQVRDEGFATALLLGMGGSSLAPE